MARKPTTSTYRGEMLPVLLALATATQPFYADPAHTDAARQARQYERAHRSRDATLMRRLSRVPQARWFTSGTPRAVKHDVRTLVTAAARKGKLPTLVAYNVPNRDCGQYSAGGAKNGRAYRRWIDGFADGVGSLPAIVILEPDALAGQCGKGRLKNVRAAVDRLARQPKTATYVGAGHSHWQPAETMAKRLRQVHASAYALNVSNFRRTKELIAYGRQISPTLHFVIDTSRNGRGPWHGRQDWCNPPRRGLGARPTTATGDPLVDAFLWIKVPGESDGECADGRDPPAGQWWPRYALGLARRAQPPL
jgi:endoglucanase